MGSVMAWLSWLSVQLVSNHFSAPVAKHLSHLVCLWQSDRSVGQFGQDSVSACVPHTTKWCSFIQKSWHLCQASCKLKIINGLANRVWTNSPECSYRLRCQRFQCSCSLFELNTFFKLFSLKPLRDRAHMGFPEHLDIVLNWTDMQRKKWTILPLSYILKCTIAWPFSFELETLFGILHYKHG